MKTFQIIINMAIINKIINNSQTGKITFKTIMENTKIMVNKINNNLTINRIENLLIIKIINKIKPKIRQIIKILKKPHKESVFSLKKETVKTITVLILII